MPKLPAPASATPAAVVTEDLLSLFLQQLSWLVGGAQDAKRAFTGWLLASPPPPSGPAMVLAQARRLSTKHLAQLEQLLGDLPIITRGQNPAVAEMIEHGHRQLAGTAPDAVRYTNLMTAVQRISVCFGTACASAAETAIVLGRVDLAAVLVSWASAWRELQRTLALQSPAHPLVSVGGTP